MPKSRESLCMEGLEIILPALRSYGTTRARRLAEEIETAKTREGKRNEARGRRRQFVLDNPGVTDEALAGMLKAAKLYSETTYVGDIARTVRDIRAKFRVETEGKR